MVHPRKLESLISLPNSFLPQLRVPVFNQRYRNVWLAGFVADDEALAIRGDIVSAKARTVNARFKQRIHRANAKAGLVGFHFGGHDFVVSREIEQLLAITPPARIASTARRNLPLPARSGKRHDVHSLVVGLRRA